MAAPVRALTAEGTPSVARAANPNRVLVWSAWLVVALSALQILCFAYGRDQGIYAMVGEGILDGRMPYRDVWDFKPPGIFLVFALAEAVFGKAMSSVRVVEVSAWLVLTAAFIRIGRAVFGRGVIGLVGAAVAWFVHAQLEFWHTAQPESFAAVLTAIALAVAFDTRLRITDGREPRRSAEWLIGMLFGAAFLLKPPLGGGAIVCAAYLGRARFDASGRGSEAVRTVLTLGTASLVPIALCAFWFWVRGAWPALSWTLFEFTPGYTSLGWGGAPLPLFYFALKQAAFGFSAIVPAGLLAALVLPPVHSREREGIFVLLGVIAMHLAGITMQAKFFQYHYGATLPLFALLAGLGIYKAYRRAARWGALGDAAALAALAVLAVLQTAVPANPGTFWQRSAERLRFLSGLGPSRNDLEAELYHVADYDLASDRRAAEAVRHLAHAGSPVFVWGFEPVIYWLANRPAASRYIYNVPQRTAWERGTARAQLMADLRRRRPCVIVVEHGDVFAHVTGDALDSAHALQAFPELEELLRDEYVVATLVDEFDLYVLKRRAASLQCDPAQSRPASAAKRSFHTTPTASMKIRRSILL